MAEESTTSLIKGPDAVAVSCAERLVDEEIQRWHEGAAPSSEEFLDQHPKVRAHPEAAIRLIYEEVCLRREQGQDLPSVEVLRRFPEWQQQLQVVFQCHRLLDLQAAAPTWPAAGEALGEFRLLAELGRGAVGRVFLAAQAGLADRQVVLKLTPCSGMEHLSLARLQHTHIVPLYTAHEDAQRKLRIMCMPYFGGAPLQQVLAEVRPTPPAERTGRHLLAALDHLQGQTGLSPPARGPLRHLLGRATYVQSVCLIGACLADALQYAHERGLIHLDLKPSNVLLAADAQPMLLDFHVAQEPLQPGADPDGVGGTPGYMSPEQQAAMTAVKQGKFVPRIVDGRSDLYSLGLLLYEALSGDLPADDELPAVMLRRHNSQVPTALANVVAKCLASDPRDRYQNAGVLATDLRRHLTNAPRRSKRSLMLGALAVVALGTLTVLGLQRSAHEHSTTEAALVESRQLRRARAADDLHTLAEQMRFLCAAPFPSSAALPSREGWSALWEKRTWLLDRRGSELDADREDRLEVDLLDLALMWADLRVRLARSHETNTARHEALQTLEEAEALFGRRTVLCRQRQACAEALGLRDVAAEAARHAAGLAPRGAREHCALGRSLLQAGDLERAAVLLDRAVELEPQGFWPNFYQGSCAYRLKRYPEALGAFRVCVALAPASADCYYNRGLVYAALGEDERALRDYDRALQLKPKLASAALNRGLLHYRDSRYGAALVDLEHARACGADEAAVCYNLALVHLARQDRSAALANVRRALQADPQHADARRLRERLQGEQRAPAD